MKLCHWKTRVPTISQLSVFREDSFIQWLMRRLVAIRVLRSKYHVYVVGFILFSV
jgi:hypothetical protein